MGEYLPGLIWLVVLLLANAFFVGAEFAVISARRSQIEPQAESGSGAARTTLWAMEHATLMLAMCQLGITVCSLVILNVAEPAIHHLLEIPFEWVGLHGDSVSVGAFVIALLVVTFLHVVIGEMVPKNIAFSVPERAALLLAPPLVFLARIFRPIIHFLNGTANGVLRIFRVEPKDEAESTFTLDQIATIVEQSTREGVLVDESGTLTATFEFSEREVGQVAVPLAKLVRMPQTASPADIQQAVATYGFSRYILTDANGLPMGYIHLKDVIDLVDVAAFSQPIPRKRIRPLAAVRATDEIEDALAVLRRTGAHVARVSDATGAVTGVLFLEDILEVLVGEVQDATTIAR